MPASIQRRRLWLRALVTQPFLVTVVRASGAHYHIDRRLPHDEYRLIPYGGSSSACCSLCSDSTAIQSNVIFG